MMRCAFLRGSATLFGVMAALVAGAAHALEVQQAAARPADSSWYVGLGVAYHRLDNTYSALGGRSGGGVLALVGASLGSRWKLEAAAAGTNVGTDRTCDPEIPASCDIFYPADSAEYVSLQLLLRRQFPGVAHDDWLPWLGVGLAYHYYSWDTFYYSVDGTGPLVAAGVDLRLAGAWGLRLSAAYSRYTSHDMYGNGGYRGTATQLGAAVVYSFR